MLDGLIIGLVAACVLVSAGLSLLLLAWLSGGGGYAFQLWENKRIAAGLIQDIDYLQNNLSAGPIILYIVYGGYDVL